MDDAEVLMLISQITELNDIHEYMNDDHLDLALALVVKLIVNPDIPFGKAPALIVQLQALSAKFHMLARYYTSYTKGPEASKKKNTYYSAHESISRLVDAIKYSARP
jgi:hypothetical protein